ncbi:MAG: S-methyl-5-thioribose-1-phosphate isomerase [bacterium]|nr:S-methyl-5-thioribose-1-phosphate isomerase [bacterium]
MDWVEDAVEVIDQTMLPGALRVLRLTTVADVVAAIDRLAVRGAPALGVVGGFGVALAHRESAGDSAQLQALLGDLENARPTAVNLSLMVRRVAEFAPQGFGAVLEAALEVRDQEIAASRKMATRGADFAAQLVDGRPMTVMTICNTGALAAVEGGTALAVAEELHRRGLLEEVVALETRPLLQGARLTTWELARMGAPHRLIVDSAAASVLARGFVDVVLTGADRIAANADTANKIGTYGLALAAADAGVPFVVVAPESTIDLGTTSGASIPIEDRGAREVVSYPREGTAPPETKAINPAFDVTRADLITAIVTERRVVNLSEGATLTGEPEATPLR